MPKSPRMGGGGANSLNSPEIADNSEFEGNGEDPQNEGGETSWTEPTFKPYEDYFKDFDITKETITEADLTGAGTAVDPYVVHSTRGFLYLSNTTLFPAANSKHIELACDIILNDETFDNDGNISGGDGIIYSWLPRNWWHTQFNGKNHNVSGLYFNDDTASGIGLFGGIGRVENLFVGSSCIISNKNSALVVGNYAAEMINVHTYSGYVKVQGHFSSGLAYGCNKLMQNCTNRANVDGYTHSSGVLALTSSGDTYTKIVNCSNYGKIVGAWGTAGITPYGRSSLIIGCKNYGYVEGSMQVGGISSIVAETSVSRDRQSVFNCENYGEIYATMSRAAGIVATLNGRVTVRECRNYGKISQKYQNDASRSGEIVSAVNVSSSGENIQSSYVYISNCHSFSGNSNPIIGFVKNNPTGSFTSLLELSECSVRFKTADKEVSIIERIDIGAKVKVKNVLAINETNEKCYFSLSLANNILLEIDNVVIRNSNLVINSFADMFKSKQNHRYNIKNLVVVDGVKGVYYGSDFSGFCVDWKSGEIGIKALSGKSFYQGGVSESWLIEKGFEKKTLR